MGQPINIEYTEFSALIPGFNAGKYDFLIAPTTHTRSCEEPALY